MGFPTVGLSWLGDDADGVLPIAGDSDGRHVLAPLLTTAFQAVSDQLRVATTLARASEASLSVIDPGAAAGSVPAAYRSEVTDVDDRELIGWAIDRATDRTARGGRRLSAGRRPVAGVRRAVDAHGVNTLVLPGTSKGGFLRRGATERIATQSNAAVVVVNGQPGYDEPTSILLPVAGGPHSGLATDVARRVAADCGAWIDVLHVIDGGATDRRRREADRYVESAARRIARPETTSTWVLEAPDPAEAIARQSQYYGLTVVGAPSTSRLRRFVHGSTNHSIRASANSVVLSARNNTGVPSLAGPWTE
jgi:nucleotide-binding universal stress UspA family protein